MLLVEKSRQFKKKNCQLGLILLHKLSTLYLLLDGGKSDKLATRFASMGKIETILEEILTLLTPQLEWDTLNILCRNNVKSRKRKWIW